MIRGSNAIPDLAVMGGMMEKEQIRTVIAPEHDRMHHDHQNKLKSDEKYYLTKW